MTAVEATAQAAIDVLSALGLAAAWDYPGYIAVYLDRDTTLVYGVDGGEWYGSVETSRGTTLSYIPALPVATATPEQVAAVLVNVAGQVMS